MFIQAGNQSLQGKDIASFRRRRRPTQLAATAAADPSFLTWSTTQSLIADTC